MSYAAKIIAAAVPVFAAFPDVQVLFVTEDGNAFMPHAESLAHFHANSNKLPRPVMIKRDEPSLQEAIAKEEVAIAERKAAKDKAAEARAASEQPSTQKADQAAAGDGDDAARAAAEKEAADAAALAELEAEQAAADAAAQLPTKPGYYADKDGAWWLLNEDGTWSWKQGGAEVDRSGNEPMAELAPFTSIEGPGKEPKQAKGKNK